MGRWGKKEFSDKSYEFLEELVEINWMGVVASSAEACLQGLSL